MGKACCGVLGAVSCPQAFCVALSPLGVFQAFGCGSRVPVLLDGLVEQEDVLACGCSSPPNGAPVTALAFGRRTRASDRLWLAVGHEGSISLCFRNPDDQAWTLHGTIALPGDTQRVLSMDWSCDDHHLLVGTDQVILLLANTSMGGSGASKSTMANCSNRKGGSNLSTLPAPWPENSLMSLVTVIRVASPAVQVAFSPNARYFATRYQDGRLVRVWYMCQDGFLVDIYLVHPRAVTSMQWKSVDDTTGASQQHQNARWQPCTLVTCCKDQMARIWLETTKSEELGFFPGCCFPMNDVDFVDVPKSGGGEEPGPLFWLENFVAEKTRVVESRFGSVDGDHSTDSKFYVVSKRQATQAWLYSISSDGSLSVYLVDGLSEVPRKTPKQMLWLRMPRALRYGSLSSRGFFLMTQAQVDAPMQAFTSKATSDILESIRMFSLDANYSVVNTVISLQSSVTSNIRNNPCVLERRVLNSGLRAPPRTMVSHRSLPLLAAVSGSEVCIFALETSQFWNSSQLVNPIATISGLVSPTAAWIGKVPLLLVHGSHGLELLWCGRKKHDSRFNALSSEMVTLGILPETPDPEVAYFEVLPFPVYGTRLDDGTYCVLCGMESSVRMWRVKLDFEEDSAGAPSMEVLGPPVDTPLRQESPGTCVTKLLPVSGEDVGSALLVAALTDSGAVHFLQHLRGRLVSMAAPVRELCRHGVLFASWCGSFLCVVGDAATNRLSIWEMESEYPRLRLEANLEVNPGPITGVQFWTATNRSTDKTPPYLLVSHSRGGGVYGMVNSSWRYLYDMTPSSTDSPLDQLKLQPATIDQDAESAVSSHYQRVAGLRRSTSTSQTQDLGGRNPSAPAKERSVSDCPIPAITGIAAMNGLPFVVVSMNCDLRTCSLDPILKDPYQSGTSVEYHPDLLSEFLLAGEFDKVGQVSAHLFHWIVEQGRYSTRCLIPTPLSTLLESEFLADSLQSTSDKKSSKERSSSSASVVCSQDTAKDLFKQPDKKRSLFADDPEELSFRTSMSNALKSTSKSTGADGSSSPSTTSASRTLKDMEKYVSVDQMEELIEALSMLELPQLSRNEQMRTLAVLETFREVQRHPGALDDAAVRFLLGAKMYRFLCRSVPGLVPVRQISAASTCWALVSETQAALLEMVVPADAEWTAYKELGVGFWLHSPTAVKQVAEQLAKAHFRKSRDAKDAALFYLALGKSPTVGNLFRTSGNERLSDFFMKDFSQATNQQAAMKNALNMRSQHKYHLAAGFFLLAGRADQSLSILAFDGRDPQLALFIGRVLQAVNPSSTAGSSLLKDGPEVLFRMDPADVPGATMEILDASLPSSSSLQLPDIGAHSKASSSSSSDTSSSASAKELVSILRARHGWLTFLHLWVSRRYREGIDRVLSLPATSQDFGLQVLCFASYLQRLPFVEVSEGIHEQSARLLMRVIKVLWDRGSCIPALEALGGLLHELRQVEDLEETAGILGTVGEYFSREVAQGCKELLCLRLAQLHCHPDLVQEQAQTFAHDVEFLKRNFPELIGDQDLLCGVRTFCREGLHVWAEYIVAVSHLPEGLQCLPSNEVCQLLTPCCALFSALPANLGRGAAPSAVQLDRYLQLCDQLLAAGRHWISQQPRSPTSGKPLGCEEMADWLLHLWTLTVFVRFLQGYRNRDTGQCLALLQALDQLTNMSLQKAPSPLRDRSNRSRIATSASAPSLAHLDPGALSPHSSGGGAGTGHQMSRSTSGTAFPQGDAVAQDESSSPLSVGSSSPGHSSPSPSLLVPPQSDSPLQLVELIDLESLQQNLEDLIAHRREENESERELSGVGGGSEVTRKRQLYVLPSQRKGQSSGSSSSAKPEISTDMASPLALFSPPSSKIRCGWRVPEAVWGCWMLDVLQVASLWRLISDSASSQLSLLSSSVLLWLSLATQQFQEQLALAGMQPLCSVELVTTVPLEVRRQWAPSPERARDLLSRLLNGVDGDGRPPPAGSHSNKIASCEPDEDLSTSFTAQLFLQTSSSSATLGPPASPSLAPGTSSQDPNSLVLSAVQDVYRELLLFAQKKEVLRVTMEELCSAVGVHKVPGYKQLFGFLQGQGHLYVCPEQNLSLSRTAVAMAGTSELPAAGSSRNGSQQAGDSAEESRGKHKRGFSTGPSIFAKREAIRRAENPPPQVRAGDPTQLCRYKNFVTALCINRSNPTLFAVSTTKGVQDISIPHSLRWRQRDAPRGEKLLDEEASTWEEAFHRFDDRDSDSNIQRASMLTPLMSPRNPGITHEIASGALLPQSGSPSESGPGRQSMISHSPDHSTVAQCMEAHPFLPFYLTGGYDGSVYLWLFGSPRAMAVYHSPSPKSSESIVAVHFSPHGFKLGALTRGGKLMLWRLEATVESTHPFQVLQVHSDNAVDFAFLGSDTVIATLGTSKKGQKSVNVWDILQCAQNRLRQTIFLHLSSLLTSFLFVPKLRAVLVGTKKGDIVLQTLKKKSSVDNSASASEDPAVVYQEPRAAVRGHEHTVKQLFLGPDEDTLVSLSSDGSVKIWSLPLLEEVLQLPDEHPRQTCFRIPGFKGVSSHGCTGGLIHDDRLLTCGADGVVVMRTLTVTRPDSSSSSSSR